MRPVLRFEPCEIRAIAGRYNYPIRETEVLGLKPEVVRKGYVTKQQLAEIAYRSRFGKTAGSWPESCRHGWT